jgi:hypothetical protein
VLTLCHSECNKFLRRYVVAADTPGTRGGANHYAVRDANRLTGTERPPARKTRWIVRPPDPRAAVSGVQCSLEQASEILRIWQANRSWVAMVIEDNLALVNCSGFLRRVG